MWQRLDNLLGRLHPNALTALAFLGVLAIGLADFLTGEEISFSVFYLGPVGLISWYGSSVLGIGASGFSAVVWLWADLSGGHVYSHPFIPLWNCLVRLSFFIIVSRLATALRENLREKSAQALSDPLTGLSNSRQFFQDLAREMERGRRFGHPFTVAYLDLDNFKEVNDTLGHDTGNEVLRAVAQVLRESIRATDSLARMGGDEFAALFPETGAGAAEILARKLREGVLSRMGEQGWPVTLSAGMITYEKAPGDARKIVKQADDLMYEVKRQGKNGVLHRVEKDGPIT
ncbi:MAG: GGDEF domain-containing protein [Pseudomonadota bacterium]